MPDGVDAACVFDRIVDDDISLESIAQRSEKSGMSTRSYKTDPKSGHVTGTDRRQWAPAALPSLDSSHVNTQLFGELVLSERHGLADQLPDEPGYHSTPTGPTPATLQCFRSPAHLIACRSFAALAYWYTGSVHRFQDHL
jgi:hypothetical protein